jgi:hypothetical protein
VTLNARLLRLERTVPLADRPTVVLLWPPQGTTAGPTKAEIDALTAAQVREGLPRPCPLVRPCGWGVADMLASLGRADRAAGDR